MDAIFKMQIEVPEIEQLLHNIRKDIKKLMASVDDLRTAQGQEAQAVASLGVAVGEAAQRVIDHVSSLVGNQVTQADVDAVTQNLSGLQAVSEQVAAIGNDPASEVPPPAEAQPLE